MSQKDKECGVSIWQPDSFEWNSNFFHSKGCGRFVWRATPCIIGAPKSWWLGLSNEVYNFSVAQLALEITGVKVERSKKDPVLLSKSSFFFDRSNLTPVISRTNYVSELLYTSLESPNIQLFGAPMIEGVALQTNQPHPFLWKKFEFQ